MIVAIVIVVVLGIGAAVFLTARSARSSAATGPDPAASGPVVAFYGDSYTLGTGASSPSKRWSTRISVERGWNEFNPSVNGLGFVNNRRAFGAGSGDLPDLIIAQDPDIVFVTMGLNDNFSYDRAADRIHAQIDEDIDRLKAALPNARFIVVEPFWYTSARPESLDVISGWVRDAADRIGADYIPGASSWIQGRSGEMAMDGLHPNDSGYDSMTSDMDAALTKLGL